MSHQSDRYLHEADREPYVLPDFLELMLQLGSSSHLRGIPFLGLGDAQQRSNDEEEPDHQHAERKQKLPEGPEGLKAAIARFALSTCKQPKNNRQQRSGRDRVRLTVS